MKKFIAAVFCFVFSSVAFAGVFEHQQEFAGEYDAVWAGVSKALAKAGVAVSNSDKSLGTMTTEWVVVKQAFFPFNKGVRTRSSFALEKVAGGKVRVTEQGVYQEQISKDAMWTSAEPLPQASQWSEDFFRTIQIK